ncbi:3-oxoacyl-ACP reductase FabG [Streptococcus moroccensis]|uniref:3-oxoacyl-[acyl-carrier protein] reductase n=1 Tax=Streptococcus moroccensis TaxID=1451356 RepID=A0ABT9YPQ5_9STRE|nr:3-oxoacyl-ACP reductase FabG [Streptococcus moroccensis]MDQ0221704.1 3-oxoacyl-[acyl-carrier protein] reductase [Streptococcus moroccensis]
MFQLKEQIAVVTGGAKGIGKGIVNALLAQEAKVIVLDKDVEAGEALARELPIDFLNLDVTKAEQVSQVFSRIIEAYGRIDILASNVGIFPQKTLENMSEDDWDAIFSVNLKGTFLVVQEALKHMKKQTYGRVVLTSSITGPVTGFPGWSHYGATKAGQLGFMRSIALEYAKFGITVNAVQPGNILTEGLIEQGEDYLKQMKATIPTHTLGEPIDIGAAVAFLASPEARFITGQTLIIDGGQILPESFDAIL